MSGQIKKGISVTSNAADALFITTGI